MREITTLSLEEEVEIPEAIQRDLTEIYSLVMEQFENLINLVATPDRSLEEKAVKLGERLTRAATRIENGWFKRVKSASEDGEAESPDQIPEILGREAYGALSLVARYLGETAERMRLLSPH